MGTDARAWQKTCNLKVEGDYGMRKGKEQATGAGGLAGTKNVWK